MTDEQALAEAGKRWGRVADVQHRTFAPGPAEKQAARNTVATLTAKPKAERTREESQALQRAQGASLSYRYVVAETPAGPFLVFLVRGQGDTWEEAFAAADRSNQRRLNRKRRGVTVEVNCVVCGKEFRRVNNAKTCSPECSRVRGKETVRARYQANPGKWRQQSREWSKANPEKVRQKKRKWYEANREKARQRFHEWYQVNGEKVRQRRRERRKASAGESATDEGDSG